MANPKPNVVEQIRAEIRALGFNPLGDQALAQMREELATANHSSEIEGSRRSPEEVALDNMLLEERAPEEVCRFAIRRFMEEDLGRSLKGVLFADNPI